MIVDDDVTNSVESDLTFDLPRARTSSSSDHEIACGDVTQLRRRRRRRNDDDVTSGNGGDVGVSP